MRKFFSNKKGQGLVEYGLIIAGVALVCAAAISLFGHKTADLKAGSISRTTRLALARSASHAPLRTCTNTYLRTIMDTLRRSPILLSRAWRES